MNASLNVTIMAAVIFQWSPVMIANLVLSLMIITSNTLALFLFWKSRSFLTPFSVYLIFLSSINVVHAITVKAMGWVVFLQYAAFRNCKSCCTLFIYLLLILGGAQQHSHVLISLNRLWAVTFPVSYRNKHTKRMALVLCLLMLLYVNLLNIPEVILDHLFYRLPVQKTGVCVLNALANGTLFRVIMLIGGVAPTVFVYASFPFIIWRRRKVRKGTGVLMDNTASAAAPKSLNNTGTKSTAPPRVSTARTYGFLIMTLLTLSIFICWTPLNVYAVLATFFEINARIVYQPLGFLWSVQAFIDPIIFIAVLPELRNALLRLFAH